MKIYIDTNDGFKCYPTNTGDLLEYEESFFDGKCPAMRFISIHAAREGGD